VDEGFEQNLVGRARRGDQDAWAKLYHGVYPRLRSYAAARVGPTGAEDLVNETMARAVAGIGRFRWEPSGFDAWLFGILRRVCLEHLRREGRDRRKARADVPFDLSEPGDGLYQVEDYRAVRIAFAQLSPSEREVLELRVISGLSAQDVGRVLHKRPGAVRTAQSRALANLRKLLDDGS
jgi:RNA polymerase sigma-70 factor (ECF subfamily)